MAKDPAFLFYSKDFYEGTRMMLPEERACYIDLLMYQHQNEYIPEDTKRLSMYCSGISEDIVKATLKAKFKLCDKGWYNERLLVVCTERKEFSGKQSINGLVGQFWKKAKAILNQKEYTKLKENLYNQSNTQILEIIKDKNIDKAMLQAMLKHLASVNVNAIVNENVNKDESEKLEILLSAQEILIFLNETANRAFDFKNKNSYSDISARLKEGYTSDELKEIIQLKTMEWINDDKMKQYLTPSTLFSAKNCNKYKEQVIQAKLNPQQFKNSINAKSNYPKTAYTNGATPFDNWGK